MLFLLAYLNVHYLIFLSMVHLYATNMDIGYGTIIHLSVQNYSVVIFITLQLKKLQSTANTEIP